MRKIEFRNLILIVIHGERVGISSFDRYGHLDELNNAIVA